MMTSKIGNIIHCIGYVLLGGGKNCIACNDEIFSDTAFCNRCDALAIKAETCCAKCGMPTLVNTNYCSRCQGQTLYFDMARSCFLYNDIAKKFLANYKLNCIKKVGEKLALFLAQLYKQNNFDCEIITYIPSSKLSKYKRGFDTTKYLAENFCRNIGREPTKLLTSNKPTKEQKTLSYKQRQINVHNKFAIADKYVAQGKTILLIDDLMTSGATVNEASRILKSHGAASVIVLTVCSTFEDVALIENSDSGADD